MKKVTHEPRLFLYVGDYQESQGTGTAFRTPFFTMDDYGNLIRIDPRAAHASLCN